VPIFAIVDNVDKLDEELSVYAIDCALKQGASYADNRLERRYHESITVMSREVKRAFVCRKTGIGVRVLVDGAWGFQSTTDLTRDGINDAVNIAVHAARACAKRIVTPVKLAETKAHVDSYSIKTKLDIEDICPEDKITEIKESEKYIHTPKNIVRTMLDYTGIKISKLFVNSEGARIHCKNSVLFVDLKGEASNGGVTRSYSQSIGGTGGYELIREGNIPKRCEEVGSKADNLLKASSAREEKDVMVVLDPSYVQVLVHEICGHASEADRILGREVAWGGASWWVGQVGKKIGSDLMTVYDDPTIPGTLGHYLYDDEGVKARRKVLVEGGVVKEYIQSRETAAIFDVEANAGMRAITYEDVPLMRMSNTFFASGDWTVEEMIDDIKHGYLVSASGNMTIDDIRHSWAAGAYEAYEIKNGELSTPICNITLTSTAPKFFQTIDAASKTHEILPWPGGCGKGDPQQRLYVGNGGPHLRAVVDILGVK
jgi:TldD protein